MNRGPAPPPPEKPPSVAERTRLLKSSFRKDDIDKPKVADKSSTLLNGEKGVSVSVNVASLTSSSSSRIANGERSPSPTTVPPSVQHQGGNNTNSIPNNALLSGGVPIRPLVQPPPVMDNKSVNGNSLAMDSNKEQNTKSGVSIFQLFKKRKKSKLKKHEIITVGKT